MVTIQLQAEPIEEDDTTILFRVRTGFGDPVLRVAKDQVQDVESLSTALEIERGRHDSITLPAAERGIKAEARVEELSVEAGMLIFERDEARKIAAERGHLATRNAETAEAWKREAEAVIGPARRLSHALAVLGDSEGRLPIPDGPELQELYDALGDLDAVLVRKP